MLDIVNSDIFPIIRSSQQN